ncbi:Modification methylase MboII [Koleobacter methoxysyntrophicus]|uniref:Modification methylase MboII n=1 Tax=Koleobacter methoxysyntrophicus TaxID=2751313 RepID=A0A8A0RSN1_9FIRM|nr:site-specific DNA-methyltransferase [Koleobacter methoxysyntrophicus]QSQ10509.1 Modification methylase MboII [Koleobacter methoxysyntrophicus]
MAFNTKLNNLLKSDSRFVDDDGELILAAVQDAAWKVDRNLVKLLLSDPEIKAVFFEEIEGHWIFDVNKFIDYTAQKNFLDNSYTRFKNRIGLTIGGRYLRERGEVALVWPYKDCYLEGGQTKEEEKRKEIFFNEVLAQDEINRLLDPKVLTNFKRYTANSIEPVTGFRRDENGVIRENLIIKGNNLLALHTLKTQFRGQVKLIYIDPPFNTERDSFSYNDNFRHSTWLTFLRNRLLVAYELLTDDGNIFVHIDNNESHYLKILLDEIFGRENFINEIIWHKGREGGSSRSHSTSSSMPTEYQNIFIYAKNKSMRFWNPPLGPYKVSTISRIQKDEKGWFYTRGRMGRTPAAWELKAGSGLKTYVSDRVDLDKEAVIKLLTAKDAQYVALGDVWSNDLIKNTKETNYDTAKPEGLLRIIVEAGTNPDDLVLDFFLGSGTTAAVCLKLKRRFIGIEQLEGGINTAIQRLYNVVQGKDNKGISKSVGWKGGGDFIYCELMKYNEAFMDRIQAAGSSEELVQIWREMAEGSFLNWYVNPAMHEEAVNDFIAIGKEPNGLEKQKRLLAELLDKNQLYVNLSEIDDAQFDVSEEDKALNRAFYGEWYNA